MEIEKYVIRKLEYDSNKFNLNVFQVSFKSDIENKLWPDILDSIKSADLIYLKNPSNCRLNSQSIAQFTDSYLIDTNVTLKLNLSGNYETNSNILKDYEVHITKKFNYIVDDLLHFRESRFICDKKLQKLGGHDLYRDWVKNSKNQSNKDFIIILNQNIPIGLLLFSTINNIISIELISVLNQYKGYGIGSSMIDVLCRLASNNGIKSIKVGTQITNKKALNFYTKFGFQVDDSIDIYHWWK